MRMRTTRRGMVSSAVAATLLLGVAMPAWAATNFSLVASPNVGASHNELHAVSVASPTLMFAVGEYFDGTWDRGLILKGNGTTWTTVAPPVPVGSTHEVFNAVSMAGVNSGFAVGTFSVSKNSYNLVAHYASSKWSLLSIPRQTGITASELDGVTVGSSSSVMAVGGGHAAGQPIHPIAALYNGKTWKYTTVPNPGKVGTLSFTAALSSVAVIPGSQGKKFWAVGTYSNGHDTFPFFDVWGGTSWKSYRLAKSVQAVLAAPSTVSSVVSSVAVIAANNAWAVGYYVANHTALPSNNRTFTVHWNGLGWSMIKSPDRVSDATPNELVAVAARGANAIYAVGRYYANPADQTQALKWDPVTKAWLKITSDSNTTQHNSLEGLAMIPVKGAVAVGTYYSGKSDRTLVDTCADC